MIWRARKTLKVFAGGTSLRRRVAYSLALVRLILAPVILLAIYYLIAMGLIVDRIVSVDAPAATLAERASMEMLDARRAERNYFLLYDPQELHSNRQSLARLKDILDTCLRLQPEEQPAIDKMLDETSVYRQRLEEAVSHMSQTSQSPAARIQKMVRAYEKDLNDLVQHAGDRSSRQLIQELQARGGLLDAQVAETLISEDSAFRQITSDLRGSSGEILRMASDLEDRGWKRVQHDHDEARDLVRRAEWVLGIVSGLTVLLSVWVSFILPRDVVRPLAELKVAVDHAAAGNYEIEFDVQGNGEVAQLAKSVRDLITHVREKKAEPLSH